MADELIDICDENNSLIGVQKMRSEAHRDGLWHRAVHIWAYNSKNEFLLQLRAKEKEFYPNVWDISAAGHVGAGEIPSSSGVRELREEIGLSIKEEDLDLFQVKKVKAVYQKMKNNEFCYIYLLRSECDITKLKLQVEEVQKVKLLQLDQLEEELKTNPEKYLPPKEYWFEMIGEMRRRIND